MTERDEDAEVIRMVAVGIAAVHQGLGGMGQGPLPSRLLLEKAADIEHYILTGERP